MRRRHTTTRLLAIAALALPVILPATPAAAAPTAPARHLSDVIPAPVETHPDAHNTFRITPLTVIRTTPGSAAAWQVGHQLATTLRPATGHPLPVLPV
ncbi:beta-N-acetylhexosaminidase, partial [Micromonospora noduli]